MIQGTTPSIFDVFQNGLPVPTTREDLQKQYWETVRSATVELFDNVADGQVMGNRTTQQCTLKLYHRLAFYLDIIYQHREVDAINDALGYDQGNAYYIDYYCVPRLKKALSCKGIPSALIRKVFEIYNLNNYNDNETSDGLGFMEIDGTTNPLQIN